jgi:hypothetical protein
VLSAAREHATEFWPGDEALNVALEVVGWPLPNVWLGTSVEDQAAADARIPALLETPAAIRFLSCEPLLGPVDLRRYLSSGGVTCANCGDGTPGACCGSPMKVEDASVDWVIIGGESGQRARPFDIAWARDLIRQCRDAGVKVFVKQLGARPYESVDHLTAALATALGDPPSGRGEPFYPIALKDRRHGGEPGEWPEDLRVREFPESRQLGPYG